tara:strand:+ start:144 stop:335 length:192 start_codon:yes stop_codon:yes gene_type:complete
MTSISQALQDIKKYLNIKNIKNVKVDYDTELFDVELQNKTKSVELSFNNKKHGFVVTVTRIRL